MKKFLQGFTDGVIFFAGAMLIQLDNIGSFYTIAGVLMVIYGVVAYVYNGFYKQDSEGVKE